MPYIVAKYLASKLVNLLIWCRFFVKNRGFWFLGLFGGVGKGWGEDYKFTPPSDGVRNWNIVLLSALVTSKSPKEITSMPIMTS